MYHIKFSSSLLSHPMSTTILVPASAPKDGTATIGRTLAGNSRNTSLKLLRTGRRLLQT